MAGGAESSGSENLKGLSKIFNSQTDFGRANVSQVHPVSNLQTLPQAHHGFVNIFTHVVYICRSRKPRTVR